MPEFDYRASTSAGKLQRGSLAADSKQAALRQLRGMGLTPVQVVAATGRAAGRTSGGSGAAAPAANSGKPMKRELIVSFTSELAVLLRAGLPLDRALKVQEEMSSQPQLRALLGGLIDDVKGGKSFSAALENQPVDFGNFYLNMVRAGEVSGHMAEVLSRLAATLETEAARRGAVISALIYPAVLCVVAVLAVVVMLGFVIPQFETLFNDMGEGLPAMTAAILAVGKFFESYGLLLLVLTAALVFASRRWLASVDGRAWRDEKLLALPLFGDVVQKFALAQFSRTLGTLLENGVKMLAAITIASDTVDNSKIRGALQALPGEVKGGTPLSHIMGKNPLFTPLVVQMVRVGEESGRLGSMLLELARIYDDEVESSIKRILALIEPALILVMGLIISLLIISILMGVLAVNDLAI